MKILYMMTAVIYSISIFLLSYTLLKGKTLVDKVLVVDVILYTSAGILATVSMLNGSKVLAVSVLVFVLWAYALDIYIAKYLEKEAIGHV